MVEASQTVLQLPVKHTAVGTDQVVFVSNAAGANGGNVAIISLANLFGNSHVVPIQQSDPANSHSWTGPSGVLFFSNTYGYISTANNYVQRFFLNTF